MTTTDFYQTNKPQQQLNKQTSFDKLSVDTGMMIQSFLGFSFSPLSCSSSAFEKIVWQIKIHCSSKPWPCNLKSLGFYRGVLFLIIVLWDILIFSSACSCQSWSCDLSLRVVGMMTGTLLGSPLPPSTHPMASTHSHIWGSGLFFCFDTKRSP